MPYYIGPFKILERLGKVTYRLALPLILLGVHNIFYVNMLKEYNEGAMPYVIDFQDIEVNENLYYQERRVQILGHEIKKL